MRPGQVAGPIILIAAGVVFLLNNMGWDFPLGYWISTFWPLILVALGLAQIAGVAAGRGSLPGGIVLLTLGVLFSLQQIWDIRFRDTWPILLIAIGTIGLLRAVLGPAVFAGRSLRGGLRR